MLSFQRREEAAKAEQNTTTFNNEPSQVDPSAASYANIYQACPTTFLAELSQAK